MTFNGTIAVLAVLFSRTSNAGFVGDDHHHGTSHQ